MDVIICGLISLLAAAPILVFVHHNQDSKKIERFYYNTDHQKYVLLQICVFILTVSLLINVRSIVMHIITPFFQKWTDVMKAKIG